MALPRTFRKLDKNSNGCISENEIAEQANKELEFTHASYVVYPGQPNKKSNYTRLSIKRQGAGVTVSIAEISNNTGRYTEKSTCLGLDELEVLLDFVSRIKGGLRNYSGEVTKDFTLSARAILEGNLKELDK